VLLRFLHLRDNLIRAADYAAANLQYFLSPKGTAVAVLFFMVAGERLPLFSAPADSILCVFDEDAGAG
jgi:hypothetical protein